MVEIKKLTEKAISRFFAKGSGMQRRGVRDRSKVFSLSSFYGIGWYTHPNTPNMHRHDSRSWGQFLKLAPRGKLWPQGLQMAPRGKDCMFCPMLISSCRLYISVFRPQEWTNFERLQPTKCFYIHRQQSDKMFVWKIAQNVAQRLFCQI
jgi:hypothetical protein